VVSGMSFILREFCNSGFEEEDFEKAREGLREKASAKEDYCSRLMREAAHALHFLEYDPTRKAVKNYLEERIPVFEELGF